MRNRLILFLAFTGLGMTAQELRTDDPCIVPPPPGLNIMYGLDYDNDGYAVFDVGYYINDFLKPMLGEVYGVSPDSYDYVFSGSEGIVTPPLMYTNTSADEITTIYFIYSGSGPTFDPLPPCFWPVEYLDSEKLIVLQFNADRDSDGILNIDEDTNDNGNLMDDDDDSDGLWNIIDPTNSLGNVDVSQSKLKIYPNPVQNGQLNIESNFPITSVAIYDCVGREIKARKIVGNTIKLEDLPSGTYFVKFQSNDKTISKKIVIQ